MSLVDMTKYNDVPLELIIDPALPPNTIKLANSNGTSSTLTNIAQPNSSLLSSVKVASGGPIVTIMPQESPLLTAKEVQAYLRISRSTLYRLLGRGELVSHKVGSAHRFYLHDVQEYIKGK